MSIATAELAGSELQETTVSIEATAAANSVPQAEHQLLLRLHNLFSGTQKPSRVITNILRAVFSPDSSDTDSISLEPNTVQLLLKEMHTIPKYIPLCSGIEKTRANLEQLFHSLQRRFEAQGETRNVYQS